MKNKIIFLGLIALLYFHNADAQFVSSYSIHVNFFPEDAQMWGYPVSNENFMNGKAAVELSDSIPEDIIFYLHSELKIDSIISGKKLLKYDSEKVLYRSNYSYVALKTTLKSTDLNNEGAIEIYYSGFMTTSRTRSLSDYMHINKNTGVYLRAYGYSLWFPVFLESGGESYEVNFHNVTVNLPAEFKSVLAGELISENIKDNRYTAVWEPGKIDLRYLQCSARNYKSIQKENIFVYYIDNQNNADKILGYAQSLKNLYYEKLRKVYDTSSLFIIVLPKFGDISSHNMIGISTGVYNDFDNDIYSQKIIAHELVHPYVHIPIKKENPFYALVIEGFPSFFDSYALYKLNGNDFNLASYMLGVEKIYKNKKQTGKDRRGNPLPPEKSILEINAEQIRDYKDLFILNDRVSLFFYHIWTTLGDNEFDKFLGELFQFTDIDYNKFEELVLKYLPSYQDKFDIWLNTTKYPEDIQIQQNK